jgi:hypothetical protein
MFDLEAEITKSLSKMTESGELSALVETHTRNAAERVVKDVISSCFGYRSVLKDELENAIKESIAVDFSKHTLPCHRNLILDAVKDELDSIVQTEGVIKAKQAVSNLLKDSVPDKITFEELIEKFIELEVDSDEIEVGGEISLEIDASRSALFFIGMDKVEGKSRYSCEHQFNIGVDDLKLNSYKAKDDKRGFGRKYGFEKYLFRLFSAGTIIEIDANNDYSDCICYGDER